VSIGYTRWDGLQQGAIEMLMTSAASRHEGMFTAQMRRAQPYVEEHAANVLIWIMIYANGQRNAAAQIWCLMGDRAALHYPASCTVCSWRLTAKRKDVFTAAAYQHAWKKRHYSPKY
jgi:hypothetical protein